jgi:lipoprotein-releasing system ATP-binding protein
MTELDPTVNAIRIEGLGKRFLKGGRTLEVLHGLDLRLEAGEHVVVVGQSGSGKSTFLHILGTLDRPTAGRVWFADRDVFQGSSRSLDRLRNKEIGFVFQFHHLLPDHSALRNVALPMLIAGMPMSQAEQIAGELLERVGLAERLHHRPGELSGGEQQRVAIARALVRKPRLILADEPTGNLDPTMASGVFDLLVDLANEWGSTLVVVTHSTEIASRFSRRLVLHEGRFQEDPLQ